MATKNDQERSDAEREMQAIAAEYQERSDAIADLRHELDRETQARIDALGERLSPYLWQLGEDEIGVRWSINKYLPDGAGLSGI